MRFILTITLVTCIAGCNPQDPLEASEIDGGQQGHSASLHLTVSNNTDVDEVVVLHTYGALSHSSTVTVPPFQVDEGVLGDLQPGATAVVEVYAGAAAASLAVTASPEPASCSAVLAQETLSLTCGAQSVTVLRSSVPSPCPSETAPLIVSLSNGSNDPISVDVIARVADITVYSELFSVPANIGVGRSQAACIAVGSTVTFEATGPRTVTYSSLVGPHGVECFVEHFICTGPTPGDSCIDDSGCWPRQ